MAGYRPAPRATPAVSHPGPTPSGVRTGVSVTGGSRWVADKAGCEHGSHAGRVADVLAIHPGIGLCHQCTSFLAAEQLAQALAGGRGLQTHVGCVKTGGGLDQQSWRAIRFPGRRE